MLTPEEQARQQIDALLVAAGWVIQDKDLIQRDKLNLDIVWLKDDSLEDIDSLPSPDIIASEIVVNLEAALEQFRAVAEELVSQK